LALPACSGHYTTRGAAVEYNRAFADARNEIVLLNILRASADEPLQFSTISNVNGAVRNGTSITLPFTNIIFGGDESINPSLTLGDRNPGITITPLETEAFIKGITRPLSVSTIDNLVAQGWDRNLVLALAIGGVQCADDKDGHEQVMLNLDPRHPNDKKFRTALSSSARFTATDETYTEVARIRVPAAEALKLLREGVGDGRRVALASRSGAPEDEIIRPNAKGEVELSISRIVRPGIEGLNFEAICPALGQDERGHKRWGIVTRSVHSMFRYIGLLHRLHGEPCSMNPRRSGRIVPPATSTNAPQDAATSRSDKTNGREVVDRFVSISSSCAGPETLAGLNPAITTRFRGTTYFVPSAQPGQGNQSLDVVALLIHLVQLQTSEATIANSRPIIAVSPN
jgi:hypothetical protein